MLFAKRPVFPQRFNDCFALYLSGLRPVQSLDSIPAVSINNSSPIFDSDETKLHGEELKNERMHLR
jgi:hypothetical protein